MVTRLCVGRPPEWWYTGDDGNRLALAFCRACPFRPRCPVGDPRPHGVIRAGFAYTDSGARLPLCVCGYPHVTNNVKPMTRCPRCKLPGLDRFAPDIQRWAARGDSGAAMARRVGCAPKSIRDALRRWASNPERTTA